MKKTLKERVNYFYSMAKNISLKVEKIIGSSKIEDYKMFFLSYRHTFGDFIELIRDQQARIEELEAEIATKMVRHHFHAPEWKPIADMPKELKDGRQVLLKEPRFSEINRDKIVGNWNGNRWIDEGGEDIEATHYMEIME